MKVIHVMQDGSTRASIEGVVVKNKEFYRVIKTIKEKKK